jgi:hypothetical protein
MQTETVDVGAQRLAGASRGIAPLRVSTFCPARGGSASVQPS